MSTLNWIVLVVVLVGAYLSGVAIDRYFYGKWNFTITFFSFFVSLFVAAPIILFSDICADEYVKKYIPHEWKEEILSTQEVEDVSHGREQEGSFFLGIGEIKERETFRYTVVNEDGTRERDKVHTSDCRILKADGKQKIVRLRIIRMYKNPADKKFFRNSNDKTDIFYKVYIL